MIDTTSLDSESLVPNSNNNGASGAMPPADAPQAPAAVACQESPPPATGEVGASPVAPRGKDPSSVADGEGKDLPSIAQREGGFPRLPGETPRAFSAFMTYFTLGRSRTLQAVADNLGEHPSTVKNWSARHHWVERIQNHQSAVLQKTAEDQATSERQHAAAWTKRLNALREREWETSERLFSAAQCFLESFGDEDLSKMTLGQVSRAVSISSQIGRSALLGVELPPSTEPALAPIQVEFMQALERAYGHLAKNDGKDAASPGSKDATPN